MPVMPSFGNFAGTPNLGEAFVGGARIAQAAQQANQQFALESAKIQAAREQAAMEQQVKQQAMQQKMMQDQQELEFQKAYKESMLGLQEREIKTKEEHVNYQLNKAMEAHQATQQYQQEAEKLIASGEEPTKAFMQSALKYGPQMDLPGGAYSQLFKGDPNQPGAGGMPEDFGQVSEIPEMPDMMKFRTGKGSYQLVKKPATGEVSEADVPVGFQVFDKKLIPDVEYRDAVKERNRLVKLEEADIPLANARTKREAGDKLSKTDQIALKRGDERKAKIEGLESKIESKRAKKPAGRASVPTPSQRAIDHLMQNPDTADQFDEMFGDGASQQYLQ